MLISVQLSLPRDARFVPVLRNVASCLMSDLGAPDEASQDIQIALSEACANAVRHASGTTDYVVSLGVGSDGCVVEVIDKGPGFDPETTATGEPDAEAGRGLLLMRELVDDFEFIRDDGEGNRLRLTKRWSPERLKLDLPAVSPS